MSSLIMQFAEKYPHNANLNETVQTATQQTTPKKNSIKNTESKADVRLDILANRPPHEHCESGNEEEGFVRHDAKNNKYARLAAVIVLIIVLTTLWEFMVGYLSSPLVMRDDNDDKFPLDDLHDSVSGLAPGPPSRFSRTLLGSFAIGAVSAMIAELCTYPMDSLKTRLQLRRSQYTQVRAPSDGEVPSIAASLSGLKTIKLLYYGVCISMFRQIPYSGSRQMIFQCSKDFLAASGVLAASGSSLFILALVAGFAGAVGQIIANWTDVLKVRMQSDGRKVMMGQQPEYKNVYDAFCRVWREEGMAGFTVGTVPNAVRAILINFADIGIYDTVKEAAGPWTGAGLGSAVVASAVCGLATSIVACPAEVARNRMMNNGPTAPVVMYHSLTDCVVKTYREGGVKAFFQGIVPFYARNGPWYLIQWMVFEQLSAHLDTDNASDLSLLIFGGG